MNSTKLFSGVIPFSELSNLIKQIELMQMINEISSDSDQEKNPARRISRDTGAILEFLVDNFYNPDFIIETSETIFDAENKQHLDPCHLDRERFTQQTGKAGKNVCNTFGHKKEFFTLSSPSLKIFQQDGKDEVFVFMTLQFFNFLKRIAPKPMTADEIRILAQQQIRTALNPSSEDHLQTILPPVSLSIPIPEKNNNSSIEDMD